MKEYAEFEIQQALHYVCSADNPKEALERFQDHVELLGEWRIMYAAAEAGGPFDLAREQFSKKGFVSTMLRGRSVWILDKAFALSRTQVNYMLGGSLFLDSNAASYIRKLSYAERISPELDAVRADLQRTFSVDDLARLNSYIYLGEAQKKWSPETRQFCKETVAAVHALSLDEAPLSEGWGERFRTLYQEHAEAFAEEWIDGFSRSLEAGLSVAIAQQAAAAECMILRAKIIECSSSASPEAKMEALLSFMHDELRIFMMRELIVCADILFHTKRTKLSEKLNSVLDKKDPLRIINNCAWDLYILRIIESLSNPQHLDGVDFCLDYLITFDEDLVDVICLTELRAVAVHLGSHRAYPFFNNDLTGWLV
ncbi:hypothetical protein FQ186_28315 [Pseudomonas sp. ANT_H14]|uniref:hypothetical protein n=1 Tax=unclassified Pseudomonas TaxID=196821 RepID=UPI0011EF9FAC|nr:MULTISPECIES: hypothetical protein [unclassified Pseudomonas]KAA0945659.1 hypothetical protein FQ186_28315 [Pseudomonas sp. ANT_H14]KAA0946285.1 hypothetical protein FQ182_14015 [Pseudomonas sp. ANT_H4]